jgi:hypothetical protein
LMNVLAAVRVDGPLVSHSSSRPWVHSANVSPCWCSQARSRPVSVISCYAQ